MMIALHPMPCHALPCHAPPCHQERTNLAFEGIVVAAVEVIRPSLLEASSAQGGPPRFLQPQVRVTTRGMWLAKGSLLSELVGVAEEAVKRLPADASLVQVSVVVCVHSVCA
jgi:hypothetical protein